MRRLVETDFHFNTPLARILIALMFCCASARIGAAQVVSAPPLNSCVSTNQAKVGAYKLIALMTNQYFQAGGIATAKRLADALEVTFDSSIHCLQVKGVSKEEAEKIDDLMDAFIKPIQSGDEKTPDVVAVAAAHSKFVTELDTIK
jgi:hypothetical protein